MLEEATTLRGGHGELSPLWMNYAFFGSSISGKWLRPTVAYSLFMFGPKI